MEAINLPNNKLMQWKVKIFFLQTAEKARSTIGRRYDDNVIIFVDNLGPAEVTKGFRESSNR